MEFYKDFQIGLVKNCFQQKIIFRNFDRDTFDLIENQPYNPARFLKTYYQVVENKQISMEFQDKHQ
jgi:hypothetical protein